MNSRKKIKKILITTITIIAPILLSGLSIGMTINEHNDVEDSALFQMRTSIATEDYKNIQFSREYHGKENSQQNIHQQLNTEESIFYITYRDQPCTHEPPCLPPPKTKPEPIDDDDQQTYNPSTCAPPCIDTWDDHTCQFQTCQYSCFGTCWGTTCQDSCYGTCSNSCQGRPHISLDTPCLEPIDPEEDIIPWEPDEPSVYCKYQSLSPGSVTCKFWTLCLPSYHYNPDYH